ncbi:MAG: BrnT family toxin [Melioribacteraceae bacterium]|nr:BrnT family toxin [Melioribacteraceae bacterium]MCF8354764.1 BrnT family toxin [Melioribacteraceae bacterium]MCF8394389.1 BrnT family toxin [Melioribacteraceae bacterium]MCF8417515.1 BrnT family toxin [Melioribacteraceae bacterium]
MKSFEWNYEKNQQLKKERNVSFEDILFYLEKGKLVGDVPHPNKQKYPNQRIFLIDVKGYIYIVPYVENDVIIIKTIIPSRKETKK